MLENIFALIIVVSFVSFIYFVSKLVINKIKKKNIRNLKKNAMISIILFILSFIGFGLVSNEDSLTDANKENEETSTVEQSDSTVEGEKNNEEEVNTDKELENDKESSITWDDLKDKEKIVGKSDKDFKKDIKAKPGPVRNDEKGNWKIIKLSKNIDLNDYALSYSEQYIDEGEIHFIVNFTNKTTTRISKSSGLTYVDYFEYVDKEEHDAKTLGSGMPLGSYIIYPDGDIEDVFNASEN